MKGNSMGNHSSDILSGLLTKKVLADTHAHLHAEEYTQIIGDIISESQKQGVEEIWLMAVNVQSMKRNLEILQAFPGAPLRIGLGIDPEILVPGGEFFQPELLEYTADELKIWMINILDKQWAAASDGGIVVEIIGEIGLDRYWLEKGHDEGKIDQEQFDLSWELQKVLFPLQLELAAERNLPVSIHSRGAEAECIRMVSEVKRNYPELRGIFHSFAAEVDLCERVLSLPGFCIGVNGIITYKSATTLREFVRERAGLVRGMPEDKVLEALYAAGFVLETDCPFLIAANAKREVLPTVNERQINVPAGVRDVLRSLV